MERLDASGVAERWKRTRQPEWKNGEWNAPEAEGVYHALVSANGDPEKINKIMGSSYWTRFTCQECDISKPVAIGFDNQEDGDFIVCRECLLKAAHLVRPQ